jgi:hypothetical protein
MKPLRKVSISYLNDDGESVSYQGELSDDDLSRLIRQLDGTTFDELALEYNGPED